MQGELSLCDASPALVLILPSVALHPPIPEWDLVGIWCGFEAKLKRRGVESEEIRVKN